MSRSLLRLKRDRIDRRGPERTAASFVASLLLHVLAALLLFSLATSASQQGAPESFSGGMIVSVKSEPLPRIQPSTAPKVPVPHARVVPTVRPAARPRSAAPHPRVLHELAKFAPTAPPNPTPAPQASAAPNPVPTEPVIAVTAAPIPPVTPTSVPTAAALAVTIKAPPTQIPQTPRPQPTVIQVTPAPIIAMASPLPAVTPSINSQQINIPAPQATSAPRGVSSPSPGLKVTASPGPRGAAPVKSAAAPRPIQPLPATPRPAPVHAVSPRPGSLNQRLQSLIPTAAPSFSPAPMRSTTFNANLMPTPQPEPTPPPDVIAATKYIYEENVAAQHSTLLGIRISAPEERYVKMYVTSVKRIGFIRWCTGWVLRAPIAGSSKWIIDTNASFVCSGRLQPFSRASPAPPAGGP